VALAAATSRPALRGLPPVAGRRAAPPPFSPPAV